MGGGCPGEGAGEDCAAAHQDREQVRGARGARRGAPPASDFLWLAGPSETPSLPACMPARVSAACAPAFTVKFPAFRP